MKRVELDPVSRTALVTLRSRADEQKEHNPLFQDEMALKWSNQFLWNEDLKAVYDWKCQASIAIRTYLFDKVAHEFVNTHSSSLVVELGAGLSTRFYRIAHSEMTWIDLDRPKIQSLRKQVEGDLPNHSLIIGSVCDFDWMNRLPKISPSRILFIAEGLLMYLERKEVVSLITELRRRFAGATFLFDAIGDVYRHGLSDKSPRRNIPLKWFIKSEQDLIDLGLSLNNVWPLLKQYPHRWRYLRWLAYLPICSSADLTIEAKLHSLV